MKGAKKITITFSMIEFFVFSLLTASTVMADGALVFGLDVRFRYEFQNHFNQKYYGDHPEQGSSDDGFLLGRFRTGFDYRPSDKIHLAAWMLDAEVWGMALPQTVFYSRKFGCDHDPNRDRWELSDTFLEISRPFDSPVEIKGGRQRIVYGDKRIFGPGQWGNTGRWIWDALRMSYKFKGGFADIYYGRTMLHDPEQFSLNHRHSYESFGTYSHFVLPPRLFGMVIEPFFMTRKDGHNNYTGEDRFKGDLNAWYAGLRICRMNMKRFDLDLTYIREFGDYSGDNLKAYGYHMLVAYRFQNAVIKPRASVEYSVASGDDNPADGRRGTFDGAFGARDKMYGRMNLFHWKNLKDAQVNLEIRPQKWAYLKTEFHDFRLAEKKDAWYLNPGEYRDKSGKSGDKVGREMDIVARFDLPRNHEIQIGGGHFWPGKFAKKNASNKQADWVFFQWEYRFFKGIL